MLQGNALVGQSGGPTAVINASLAGLVESAVKSQPIERVLGMRFGIEGVLEKFLVDLSTQPADIWKSLRATPSSALGSSRLKLQQEHFPRILQCLQEFNIRYFFMIGGNDTMDTIHRVTQYARQQGYQLMGVGVSKTVDNDLPGTDHTPGYPSAARYVALSVLQAGLLARDMQRADQFTIFQTVGRSAGWLPAAAACARRRPSEAPHIILFPERPFDQQRFLQAAEKAQQRWGYVSIVCGEGVTHADGTPISAAQTQDKFGNIEFGAMGGASAGMVLHRILSDQFGWRGEFQVVESLQMCAADRAVKLDIHEAYQCGKQAVRLALKGNGGVMVTITRQSKRGQTYKSGMGEVPLVEVANRDRPMPDKYIGRDGMSVTSAFLDYIRPLVGDLPQYADLIIKRAKRM